MTLAGISVIAINAVGAIVISIYTAQAFASLIWMADMRYAQRKVAEGGLTALSLMVAGTLIKTLELRSWHQIGLFAIVFALRTLVKHSLSSIPQHI